MNNPLISIIVPVYNVKKYLERCVSSICNQTYKNLEIILVDDGSSDGSGEICDQLAVKDERIRVIHKSNGGLSDARNTGLDVVTGEFITCIDSDDFVSRYYVENLYIAITAGKCQLACCSFVDYYEGDTVPEAYLADSSQIHVMGRENYFRKMLYQDGTEICAVAKLYKSGDFEGIRFPKGKLYEDISTTYRLIEKAEKIAVIPNVDYLYFQRSGSIAHSSFDKRKMDAIVHMGALKDYITEHYPNLENAARCRYFSTVCNIIFLIDSNRYEAERKYLWNEIKKHRIAVMKDREGRKKARYAAILSFFGYNIMKYIYLIGRRK